MTERAAARPARDQAMVQYHRAAPGTADTVPETLLAYADHRVNCDLMQPDHDEDRRCIDTVRAAGMDIDRLAARLQAEGAAAFVTEWTDLLVSIQTKLIT